MVTIRSTHASKESFLNETRRITDGCIEENMNTSLDTLSSITEQLKSSSKEEGMTTIFCVEGNSTALRLQTALFQMSGYAVLAANDPDTALELAKDNAFDVAIVDDQFPHASGMYIAREIRRMKPNVRIVFLSRSSRMGWEDFGEADEYVSEVEGFEVLLHKVQNLLELTSDHASCV